MTAWFKPDVNQRRTSERKKIGGRKIVISFHDVNMKERNFLFCIFQFAFIGYKRGRERERER